MKINLRAGPVDAPRGGTAKLESTSLSNSFDVAEDENKKSHLHSPGETQHRPSLCFHHTSAEDVSDRFGLFLTRKHFPSRQM